MWKSFLNLKIYFGLCNPKYVKKKKKSYDHIPINDKPIAKKNITNNLKNQKKTLNKHKWGVGVPRVLRFSMRKEEGEMCGI